MDGFKLKSFFSANESIINMKREPMEWDKILATHTSDRTLISRIYEELKILNTQKANNPINKWTKELSR